RADVDRCSTDARRTTVGDFHLPTIHRRSPMRTSLVRLVALLAALTFAACCSPGTSRPPTPAEVTARLDGLAVPFVENAGQSDPRVAYYAPTLSGTVFVTRQGELDLDMLEARDPSRLP